MSEQNPGDLGNLDTSNARKSGPMSPPQRERKQTRFLKAYRESGNIKHSCKVAGINRQTYYNWRDHDEAFQAELPDAREDACDTLEFAAYDRAVQGIPRKVVSMGRVVYEEIPVLDEEGKPKLNKQEEPIVRHGKPLIEREYSDSLLITLLKGNLPKKYKDKVELVGKNDGPVQTQQVEIYKVRLPDNGRDSGG